MKWTFLFVVHRKLLTLTDSPVSAEFKFSWRMIKLFNTPDSLTIGPNCLKL